MSVSFLELSKVLSRGSAVIVYPNGTLVFDTIVSSDGLGTQIDYDTSTGIITFLEAGYYYIDWFVAPKHGLTTDGSNWAIQTSISQQSIIGSSHVKVSVTTGFALLNAAANETVRLVNVSDGPIYLSHAVQAQAGLIVYSIAVMNLSP